MRYIPFLAVIVLTVIFVGLGFAKTLHFLWPLAVLVPLLLIGIWDLTQRDHSLRRLYPELTPHHLRVRMDENRVLSADHVYDFLAPGALLDAPDETIYRRWWSMADADSFAPRPIDT